MTAIVCPGNTLTQAEIISIVKRLVRLVRLVRQVWAKVKIVFRADCYYAKPEVMDRLEDNDVNYVIGLAQNSVLNTTCQFLAEKVKACWQCIWQPRRRFHSFYYKTQKAWGQDRRVICRALANNQDSDLSIQRDQLGCGAQYLYKDAYCQRGNAELMVKGV
jgi:hypothetical protein